MNHPLWMSIGGAHTRWELARILEFARNGAGEPVEVNIDRETLTVEADLLSMWDRAQRILAIYWAHEAGTSRSERRLFLKSDMPHNMAIPNFFTSAEEILSLIEELPGTLFSMNSVWPDEWPNGRVAERYGFSDGHTQLGWGCAFKGEGHDRLVSRRWLEHGPWRVLRGKNDTTLIQFHDLTLGPEASFAQAQPTHDRMGISDNGGFLQSNYVYETEIRGLYEPTTKTFKVVVHGREVSELEMLDMCAYRQQMKHDPKTPIEQVAYVFVEEAAARAHLHQLWLRELQCFTVDGGTERRLDDDYHPTPSPPEWVKAVDAGR